MMYLHLFILYLYLPIFMYHVLSHLLDVQLIHVFLYVLNNLFFFFTANYVKIADFEAGSMLIHCTLYLLTRNQSSALTSSVAVLHVWAHRYVYSVITQPFNCAFAPLLSRQPRHLNLLMYLLFDLFSMLHIMQPGNLRHTCILAMNV